MHPPELGTDFDEILEHIRLNKAYAESPLKKKLTEIVTKNKLAAFQFSVIAPKDIGEIKVHEYIRIDALSINPPVMIETIESVGIEDLRNILRKERFLRYFYRRQSFRKIVITYCADDVARRFAKDNNIEIVTVIREAQRSSST